MLPEYLGHSIFQLFASRLVGSWICSGARLKDVILCRYCLRDALSSNIDAEDWFEPIITNHQAIILLSQRSGTLSFVFLAQAGYICRGRNELLVLLYGANRRWYIVCTRGWIRRHDS